jgi:hypothetical protein
MVRGVGIAGGQSVGGKRFKEFLRIAEMGFGIMAC